MVWPFSTSSQRTRQSTYRVAPTAVHPRLAQPVENEFIEFLEFWKTGNLPSNKMLLRSISRIAKNPVLQPKEYYAQATKKFLNDLQDALHITERLLMEKNNDEILQNMFYHLSLSLRTAFKGIAMDRRIYLGGNSHQNWFLGTGHEEDEWKRASETARKETELFFGILRFMFTSPEFQEVLSKLSALASTISTTITKEIREPTPIQTSNEKFAIPDVPFSEQLPSMYASEIPTFPKRQPPDVFVEERTRSEPYFSNPDPEISLKEQYSEVHSSLESVRSKMHVSPDETQRITGGASLAESPSRSHRQFTSPACDEKLSPPSLLKDLPIFKSSKKYETEQPAESFASVDNEPLMASYDKIEEKVKDLFQMINADSHLHAKIREFFNLINRILQSNEWEQRNAIRVGAIPMEVRRDANFQYLFSDIKTLIGRLSNEEIVSNLLTNLQQLVNASKSDIQLKSYIKEWGNFCKWSTRDEQFINSYDFSDKLRSLIKIADDFLFQNSRYQELFHQIGKDWAAFTSSFSSDMLARQFVSAWSKVFIADVMGDVSRWTLSYFLGSMPPTLTADIRHFIVPELLQQFQSMTIPEIVCEDKDFNLFIRNVRISPENILPADCEITLDNRIHMRPRDRIFSLSRAAPTETLNGTRIVIRGMRTSFKDVFFRYEPKPKNSSFQHDQSQHPSPALQTGIVEGLVDVDVNQTKGLTIVLELFDSPLTKRDAFHSTLEARVVHVRFHGLKLHFHDTCKDTRLNWKSLYASWRLRKMLQQAVEEKIKVLIGEIDQRLTNARRSMDQGSF